MGLTTTDRIFHMSISRTTNVKNLGATIAKNIQRGKIVRMTAIGAGAVNQMVKASACSLQYLAPVGIELHWKVHFSDRPVPDDIKQAQVDSVSLDHDTSQDTWSAIVMESATSEPV